MSDRTWNPYESPRQDGVVAGLQCPYCHAVFRLTWARYWLAPTGIHRCPICRRRSKLRVPTAAMVMSSLASAAIVGGSAVTAEYVGWSFALAICVGLMGLLFHCDKQLDENRRLEPWGEE